VGEAKDGLEHHPLVSAVRDTGSRTGIESPSDRDHRRQTSQDSAVRLTPWLHGFVAVGGSRRSSPSKRTSLVRTVVKSVQVDGVTAPVGDSLIDQLLRRPGRAG
jgi:hypothetical protein